MIRTDVELNGTRKRIETMLELVNNMRKSGRAPENYRNAAEGFLCEVQKMQREVREYLLVSPTMSDTASVPAAVGQHH
jgi:hypothetical protein